MTMAAFLHSGDGGDQSVIRPELKVASLDSFEKEMLVAIHGKCFEIDSSEIGLSNSERN